MAYFVFTLPFQQFVIHWTLVALVVVLLVTTLSHYLNGGIRMQGQRPRVRPSVKAHLSVILGLIALTKAVGYYLARFNLDLSSNGFVQGAGYTDVHARLPALELLILVSLAAAALLIYNIRRQGWALPILGVGLWFLVALTAGTIYPAAVQALKVNPAQNTLERPYIQRNIDATRAAMGIQHVQSVEPYPASSALTADPAVGQRRHAGQRPAVGPDCRPSRPTTSCRTPAPTTSSTRWPSTATTSTASETPVVVGVREINDQDLPSTSWVNTTLQYTHGYGMIVSPANVGTSNGDPAVRGGRRAAGVERAGCRRHPAVRLLRAEQHRLRGGQHQAARDRLPADQRHQRRDPLQRRRRACSSPRSSTQVMFAVRFNDLNLLISSQITNESRLMFDRGVQARVSKAAPFLSLDADPVPGLRQRATSTGCQDAYTTTDNYPYAQNADTSAVAPGSGLARQRSTTCGTRSRSSSTPTPAR